jgi:hypothetical protein
MFSLETLDPVVHGKVPVIMDCRIKSGNDAGKASVADAFCL